MIILEKPYVSGLLVKYAEENNVPVLRNPMSQSLEAQGHKLNLLNDSDFEAAYHKKGLLYSMSENALQWVYSHLEDTTLAEKIKLLKDKATFREICSSIYPDFFYKRIGIDKLFQLNASELNFPLVIKPAVGFLSAGVYVVRSTQEWDNAIADIKQNFEHTSSQFPDFVIGHDQFLLEQYIKGDEFAVDAYFDASGAPVILNIFHHRFVSDIDVSDRLYCTSKAIFDKYLVEFTEFLNRINALVDLRNFPMHIEFRYDGSRAVPIEINPLRFAGFCLNELQSHISGIHPVKAYFNGLHPNYTEMWKGRENDVFSFLVLERPATVPAQAQPDEAKFNREFSDILEFRRVSEASVGVLATMFTRTSPAHIAELDKALTMNMEEFIIR